MVAEDRCLEIRALAAPLPFYDELNILPVFQVCEVYRRIHVIISHPGPFPIAYPALQSLFPVAKLFQKHPGQLLKLNRLYQNLADPGEGNRCWSHDFFLLFLLMADIHLPAILKLSIYRFHCTRSTLCVHWTEYARSHLRQEYGLQIQMSCFVNL